MAPGLRHAAAPTITVLRWGSVGYALVALGPMRDTATWTDVVTIAVCVFLTTFRTLIPLDLGDLRSPHKWVPLFDVLVFSAAVGWTGGTTSPWYFCMLTAVAVGAFGWGGQIAILGGALAVAAIGLSLEVAGEDLTNFVDNEVDLAVGLSIAVVAAGGVFIRGRVMQAANMMRQAGGELLALQSANHLLTELSEVALTLPGAFTLRDALGRIRNLVTEQLDPRVIALLTLDEHNEEWAPKITDRCAMRTAYATEDLPDALLRVHDNGEIMVRNDDGTGFTEWLTEGSRSGLYVPLRARGRLIGLLALEHPEPGHFDNLDPTLSSGLADVIALTVDNARWFGRLRSLGAEEERIRVARDIHDRLGQWMTFIKLELERLARTDDVDPAELRRLNDDAGQALEELRETLRQLRTGVSDDRPLAVLGSELVARFADRTDVAARFRVAHPEQRLPVPVETELFRILQEALNNVDRHADAEHVEIDWNVDGGNYELTVVDDGRGFDAARAVREQSYGVIGMRERAEVIGASFDITSERGNGTRLCVRAGRAAVPAAS